MGMRTGFTVATLVGLMLVVFCSAENSEGHQIEKRFSIEDLSEPCFFLRYLMGLIISSSN